MKFTAILSYWPIETGDLIDDSLERNVLSELASTILPISRSSKNLGTIKFKVLKKVPSVFEPHCKQHIKLLGSTYIRIDFDLKASMMREIRLDDDKESFSWLVETTVYNLFVVMNIAKPGLFSSNGGVLFKQNGFISTIDSIRHSIEFALEKSQAIGWPYLTNLPFAKVWQWFIQFEQETSEISEHAIGRALNAFSNIFHDSVSYYYEDILWALIGLEALYCQGNSNLLGQLNEKSKLLLGERTSFKSEFQKMYDYRSRFVHGDLNIPNKRLYADSSEKIDKYFDSHDSARSLAIATLIATFQKLITENWSKMTFEYVVKGERS
jgi:hypothetical protein